MALAHTLGFPRIGRDRELKKAQEAFWKGELDEAGLRAVGRQLRAAHWQVQKDAGIQLLPVGDFAWYDQVLTHSLTFGVIPERFRAHGEAGPTLHTLFGMARGVSDDSCCGGAHAQEMTKWFDTNYHYLVPEFSADQQFQLSWEQLFEEVDEARALGHQVKPVLIGPLTYLWLGKAKGAEFDRLDLLDRLLPLYGQILRRLAGQGVEWVQIDEPILVLDLPQAWKNAFERAYNLLQSEPLKKLVATYFGGLEDNLGLAANLPVDGLHIDLVRAPEQYPSILDRLPAYKVVSLGLVNGRNVWRCDLEKALEVVRHARERLGERLWVAPSCSLLHSPVDLEREDGLDAELKSWLAFAVQKCREVAVLARAATEPEAAEVVRRIYCMALEGYGLAEIAARLAADGVVNSTYYWRSRGTSRGGSKSTVEPTKWGHTTVKKILTLQEYCGDVINFKSYSKSYKMKKRIENPEENRAIFLNVHEAIIDRQTWEKVQALQKGTRRKKPTVTQESSVFSGLLKCPECGGNLNFHFNQNNHDIKFFSCQNHNSGYRKCSKTHYIRLDFLEQVVLYEVKRLACFASEYENDFIKAMIGRSAKVAENTALRKQRELDALTARDRELDMLFERLYEDNVAGKIDDARFAKMSKRYEQEQGENAKKIKALRLELKKDESKRMDIDDFLETVRRYTDATTITKRMVAELIDHIEVYHAEKQDGVTNQRVVIYYNCIGAFDVPDRRKIPEADIIMETRKGVALSYAPEQVAV